MKLDFKMNIIYIASECEMKHVRRANGNWRLNNQADLEDETWIRNEGLKRASGMQDLIKNPELSGERHIYGAMQASNSRTRPCSNRKPLHNICTPEISGYINERPYNGTIEKSEGG
jgi:hypothetical protein